MRQALRSLAREKGFTSIVVLTLTLAMGAVTTIYTMVHFSLLRPLPFHQPESIAFVWCSNRELGQIESYWSFPDFDDLRRQVHSFKDMAALRFYGLTLTGLGPAARIPAVGATWNFFSMMGLDLVLGRGFLPEEDRPGAPPVAVISHGAWKRRFGADPEVVGKTILLDGQPTTVVGVMTPDLEIGRFMEIEVWTPLRPAREGTARDERDLMVWTRLKPGVTAEQAQSELVTLTEALEKTYPATNSGWSATVVGYPEWIVGRNARAIFALLVLTVGFVMLIACGNVAGLLLARATERSRELSVRRALGAGRLHLLAEALKESLCLSLVGGALGLVFAQGAFALLVRVTRGRVAFFQDLEIDPSVAGFTLLATVVTPLLFGLLPALHATRADPSVALRQGGLRLIGGVVRQRFRRSLVAAEVGLALVLLVATALMLRSLYALTHVELGFDPKGVLTARVDLPPSRAADASRVREFFKTLVERVGGLPGVESVGLIDHRPIVGGLPHQSFTIVGKPPPEPGKIPAAAVATISPKTLSLLRVPLLQGRSLSARDSERARPVALVSHAARERYWGPEDALGAQIQLGKDRRTVEIVGVVGDLRHPNADREPEPQIYLPYAQNGLPCMALLVRATRDPAQLSGAVRGAVWELDPDQPVDDVRTMEEILYDDFASSYALFGLLTVFAVVALGLAAAGLYAVLSFSVSQRSPEVGIRMALGAGGGDIFWMFLAQALRPVAVGMGVGLAGALALSRALEGLIYGIPATDPASFAGVAALLAVVCFLAVTAPALRAARGSPASRLRHE